MPEAGSVRARAELLQVGLPMQHFRDMAERVLSQYPFEKPMAPALAAGCTVVLKPAPTPLETFVLGEVADAAGLPPGAEYGSWNWAGSRPASSCRTPTSTGRCRAWW